MYKPDVPVWLATLRRSVVGAQRFWEASLTEEFWMTPYFLITNITGGALAVTS